MLITHKPKKLFAIIVLLISVLLAAKTPQQAFALTNCDVSASNLIPATKEIELLGLINIYRQQNNLNSLTWSSILKQAAAWQSNDMATHNSFNHIDSLGRIPPIRFTDCGYIWRTTGENIEMGDSTAQNVFNAWKNSVTHNAIMLSSTAKEAGIASINSYWTLDIGSTSAVVPTSTMTPTQPTSTPGTTPQLTPSTTPTPSPTPSIITNPTDTQIDVSIKLPGVGESGNTSPKHLTRAVTIGIFDSDNKLVIKGNGFLKFDGKNLFEGVIHLGQLANGTYLVKVQSANTLITLIFPQFQNFQSENVNILPSVALTAGDFNNDNAIDIKDYNLALPCFQNKNCDGKSDVDINDDGKGDVIDYNLLLSDFRQYEGD